MDRKSAKEVVGHIDRLIQAKIELELADTLGTIAIQRGKTLDRIDDAKARIAAALVALGTVKEIDDGLRKCVEKQDRKHIRSVRGTDRPGKPGKRKPSA